MMKTKRRGLTPIMYQVSTLETGEVIESVNTAKRVVDWFRFQIFHDFNRMFRPCSECPKNESVWDSGYFFCQCRGQDHVVTTSGWCTLTISAADHSFGSSFGKHNLGMLSLFHSRKTKICQTMEKKKGDRLFWYQMMTCVRLLNIWEELLLQISNDMIAVAPTFRNFAAVASLVLQGAVFDALFI